VRQWYVELFRNYADRYENEPYTKGTKGEVDFIEKEIKYNKKTRILDLGCGTGRHSIELAKRGYKVAGVDLSSAMLARARKNAASAGVKIDFIRADARYFRPKNGYDLVIMVCGGAFPLMETDDMNYMILRNAARLLKKGGKFIFTTLNGLFPLVHSVKKFVNAGATKGESTHGGTFDLMTFRYRSVLKTMDDNGRKMSLRYNERYYVPSEIVWLLKSLGFKKIDIFGCKLGKWSRKDKLSVDNFEMLVVGEKNQVRGVRS
jgi:2-polyprenyl-3-methyl-5-hydroxy-6-metoxy-1,4-benzoquinol methylase